MQLILHDVHPQFACPQCLQLLHRRIAHADGQRGVQCVHAFHKAGVCIDRRVLRRAKGQGQRTCNTTIITGRWKGTNVVEQHAKHTTRPDQVFHLREPAPDCLLGAEVPPRGGRVLNLPQENEKVKE